MKLVVILQDTSIDGVPKFIKGQEVRISDELADQLVARKQARLHIGKPREQVKKEKIDAAKQKATTK